jgi:serine/threonine/tyrosine-interacting protein
VKDWKYEWRRTAQPILTFLHLGPSSAAKDIEYLRREGITMLLVVRDTATARVSLLSGDKMAKELGIESRAVDVAGNPELIAAFPRAIKTINDHLIAVYRHNAARGTIRPDFLPVTPGRVMVFCESGNERSAVVVAAYLMFMYKLNLIEAIQYVQSQRFCVAFDDGLKNLLQSYNDLLDAQRSVISASTMSSKSKAKRGRDEISEDDMDVDLDRGDDEARFGSRSTFAPFYDNAS